MIFEEGQLDDILAILSEVRTRALPDATVAWRTSSWVARPRTRPGTLAPLFHGFFLELFPWFFAYPGPLAQLAEQRTFNPRVLGSIPRRPTLVTCIDR